MDDTQLTTGASLASVDPVAHLAVAAVIGAAKDYHRRRHITRSVEALIFLLGPGLDWLDACGVDVDPDAWQAWVRRGCPGMRLSGSDAKSHE